MTTPPFRRITCWCGVAFPWNAHLSWQTKPLCAEIPFPSPLVRRNDGQKYQRAAPAADAPISQFVIFRASHPLQTRDVACRKEAEGRRLSVRIVCAMPNMEFKIVPHKKKNPIFPQTSGATSRSSLGFAQAFIAYPLAIHLLTQLQRGPVRRDPLVNERLGYFFELLLDSLSQRSDRIYFH